MHLFYQPDPSRPILENEEARHCSKVLRARVGDEIRITDGRGTETWGSIWKIEDKRISYKVIRVREVPLPDHRIHMAVCPTRKAERNEWMVEKMTELGVYKIHFVVSEHTHRETLGRVLNLERLHKIALSAMKQSQQYFLPELSIFPNFAQYLAQVKVSERYIAYVAAENAPSHLLKTLIPHQPVEILIGPEGDFSKTELDLAFSAGFRPVSLGDTRLRTETAAVIACHSALLAQIV